MGRHVGRQSHGSERPLWVLLLLAGCQGYDYEGGDSSSGFTSATSSGDDWDGQEPPNSSDTTPPPPEEEEDSLRFSPATTPEFIFVTNPDRDTLTRIAVPSLSVVTAEVGDSPLQVATSADGVWAMTLDVGSSTLSRVNAATMEVTTIEVRPHLNRMSVSPNGSWAFCWFDPEADGAELAEGVQSYTEASLVHLDRGVATALTVGKSPQSVSWTDDGARAVVLSVAELTVVSLTDEPTSAWYALEADNLSPPPAEELVLTPDGSHAFVRRFGDTVLLLVSLDDGTVTPLDVGTNPTDMDLDPDGDTLVVVARDSELLQLFDVHNPAAAPRTVPLPAGAGYGSLAFADGTGVLYTNASAVAELGLWDPTGDEIDVRTLIKPVARVGVSDNGETLLLFHTQDDAVGADSTSPFFGEWALTVYDLPGRRQNPLLLSGEPTEYAISEDGWGFFIMDGQPYLEAIDFDTLLYQEVVLKSIPVHAGVLPGTSVAYASQEHDLGRISFFDADSGTVDTVTGFELNAAIEVESSEVNP